MNKWRKINENEDFEKKILNKKKQSMESQVGTGESPKTFCKSNESLFLKTQNFCQFMS